MSDGAGKSLWGFFIKRTYGFKTTWKFRLLLFVGALILLVCRGVWAPAVGLVLVHRGELNVSEVLIVENFDTDYLLFEKAGELQRGGFAKRVWVPVESSGRDETKAGLVPKGLAEFMCQVAKIQEPEIIPIRNTEPITYNLAAKIGQKLEGEGVGSIIVVSPAFRSKRDYLIYEKILRPKGIKVYCVPVYGAKTPENWIQSWHGVQEVMLQLGKLIYYQVKM